MRSTLLLCIVATAFARRDAPVDDAAAAAPAAAPVPAPAPADGAAAAAPAPKASGSRFTRPGKYPLNPAGLARSPDGMPDGVLGDDVDSVGRQLKVSMDALRAGRAPSRCRHGAAQHLPQHGAVPIAHGDDGGTAEPLSTRTPTRS